MNRLRWQWIGVLAAFLVGAVKADEPVANADAVIVLREPGKPERKCVIERTTPQPDGTYLHEVREAMTGERMRVVDRRQHKGLIGQLADPTSTVTSKPAEPHRLPTTADLAGYSSAPNSPVEPTLHISGFLRRTKPAATTLSPVQLEVKKLKDAIGPSEREVAAMTLTLSDARNTPAVIEALAVAAKIDPAPSVRVCLVRCLYRLSAESPQLVPVIQAMQSDPDNDVSRAAQSAMLELGKR